MERLCNALRKPFDNFDIRYVQTCFTPSGTVEEAFLRAVKSGDVNKCQDIGGIIDQDESQSLTSVANYKNALGETPLALACRFGYLDVVRYLVGSCQADVTQPVRIPEFGGYSMGTPLHSAVMSGNLRLVQFLVQNCKADVNAITTESNRCSFVDTVLLQHLCQTSFYQGDNTPLHYAVFHLPGEKQTGVVTYLVQNGADLMIRNKAGQFPWELAEDATQLFTKLWKRMRWNLEMLKENLFQVVGRFGSVEELQEVLLWLDFLHSGMDLAFCKAALINSANNRGETLLTLACKLGQLSLVRAFVLDCHADVNQTANIIQFRKDGLCSSTGSPLHAAVVSGNVDLVRFLAENGADLLDKNSDGKFAWELMSKIVDGLKLFIELGMDVNHQDETTHETLAHVWVRSTKPNALEVIRVLLNSGADFTYVKNAEGLTPLMIVALESFNWQYCHVILKQSHFTNVDDKLTALEFCGAAYILRDRYGADFGAGFWKMAIDLRLSLSPMTPSSTMDQQQTARYIYNDVRQLPSVHELEVELSQHKLRNNEKLIVRAILTVYRVIGPDSKFVRNMLFLHAVEGSMSPQYSKGFKGLEWFAENSLSTEEPLQTESILMSFGTLVRKLTQTDPTNFSGDDRIVCFENLMAVLNVVAVHLKRAKSDQNKYRDQLLHFAVRLTASLLTVDKSTEENSRVERCLHELVQLEQNSDARIRNTLLLKASSMCRPSSNQGRVSGIRLPSVVAVINLLLEQGADPDFTDANGDTALQVLMRNGHTRESPAVDVLCRHRRV